MPLPAPGLLIARKVSTMTTTAPARTSDLLNLDQAAAYIGIDSKALRWLRYTERGPKAAKLGGRVMFKVSLIDQWIEDGFNDGAFK